MCASESPEPSGKWHTGDGQLGKGSPLLELVCVDLLAPLELRKPPAGLGFVGIYLPAAGAFTILAPVENCLLYTSAMKNLRENGYVNMDPDGFITLCPKGQEIAERMYERHVFLLSLIHI